MGIADAILLVTAKMEFDPAVISAALGYAWFMHWVASGNPKEEFNEVVKEMVKDIDGVKCPSIS